MDDLLEGVRQWVAGLDVLRPLYLVHRQTLLPVLQVHQCFEHMRLQIVLCVFNAALHIDLSLCFAGANEVQATQTAAEVVEGLRVLPLVELQRRQVEIGDVVEMVEGDGPLQV